MKTFIKDCFNKIVSGVIVALILACLPLFSIEIRKFLLLKSAINLIPIVIFIVLGFIIVILIYRLNHKNKVIHEKEKKIQENEMKIKEVLDTTENYAKKNGFTLYKNFAYYKPDEGTNILYCKPCLDDGSKERVLQKKDEVFFDCSSCGKRAIDTELQDRIIKHNERSNGNYFTGY